MSDGDPASPGVAGEPRERPPDSPVVTTTVRLLVPFVVTFGLFTMFHGTSSAGGGFQGGVVVAAGVIAIAFAFGLERTGRWLRPGALTVIPAAGVLGFVLVAGGPVVLGAEFLDLSAYPVAKAVVFGVEAVELCIGATVATTVVLLFQSLGGG